MKRMLKTLLIDEQAIIYAFNTLYSFIQQVLNATDMVGTKPLTFYWDAKMQNMDCQI